MAQASSDYDHIDRGENQVNGPGGDNLDPQQKLLLERYQTASSVIIPREVFESMYLAPYHRTLGHLRSIFGNPTPM